MSNEPRYTDDGERPLGENHTRHNGAPDRFVMVSGGMDSVALAYHLIEDKWSKDYGAWNKRPVVIYLDTTIGLSSQRLYVQLLADYYNWHLWVLRTPENFDDHSEDEGFYSPYQHRKIFNRIKGRQPDKLSSVSANPHFYWGSRWDESEKRENIPYAHYDAKMGVWNVNAIVGWSNEFVPEYLKTNNVPYNPNWDSPHFTDCGCGATASREELIELESEGYRVMARKLRKLEDRVETGDRREVWAWASFSADLQKWLDDPDNREEAGSGRDGFHLGDIVCGPNCSSSSKGQTPSCTTDKRFKGYHRRFVCDHCNASFYNEENARTCECGPEEYKDE